MTRFLIDPDRSRRVRGKDKVRLHARAVVAARAADALERVGAVGVDVQLQLRVRQIHGRRVERGMPLGPPLHVHFVDHGAAVAEPIAHVAVVTASSASEARSWSSPCPGSAGGKCCCENLDVLSAGGKPPVVDGGGRVVAARASSVSKPLAVRPALRSRFAFSPALPRAPPQFS